MAGSYAAARPGRVAALVLVDAGGSPKEFPADMVEEYRKQLAADYRRFTDAWWDGILQNAGDDVKRLVAE